MNASTYEILNAVFGAGLGAAFYVLMTANKFLTEGIFDPKYNSTYFTRLVCGIISGSILYIITDAITKNGGNVEDATAIYLAPGIAAIVGGFSCEIVEQVLQRLGEILLATLRGEAISQKNVRDAREKLTALKVKVPAQAQDIDSVLATLK